MSDVRRNAEEFKKPDFTCQKDSSSLSFMSELLGLLDAPTKGGSSGATPLVLRDRGQVDRMTLPQGWVEGECVRNVVFNSSYQDFYPDGQPEARLTAYFRGRRTSEES